MRRHHLLDQMAQRQPRHDDVVLLAAAGQLGKDVAAAFGLCSEQSEVFVMRVGGLGAAQQLLGHHGDGRKRGTEAVGRRRGETVERRQFLLPRQHQLRRGQGFGHAPRLFRRAP